MSSSHSLFSTMSYQIVAISNEKGAPEQAYNKLEKAAASSGANFAGELSQTDCIAFTVSCVAAGQSYPF